MCERKKNERKKKLNQITHCKQNESGVHEWIKSAINLESIVHLYLMCRIKYVLLVLISYPMAFAKADIKLPCDVRFARSFDANKNTHTLWHTHSHSAGSSACKTIEATAIAEWSVDINSRQRASRYNQCKYFEAKSDWKFDFLLNTFIYSLSFCLPVCWAFASQVCILCSISGGCYVYLDKSCGTPRLARTLSFDSSIQLNARYKNIECKGFVAPSPSMLMMTMMMMMIENHETQMCLLKCVCACVSHTRSNNDNFGMLSHVSRMCILYIVQFVWMVKS